MNRIHQVPRRIDKVYIHCSASDNPLHDDIAIIRGWHLERGFVDVGYHFFIRRNGTVQAGRALEKIPAAQDGHNAGSIAICLHGLEKSKFSKEQFRALTALCDEIQEVYPYVTFHGHCEVSRKTCPVFDYRQVLALDKNGRQTISKFMEA